MSAPVLPAAGRFFEDFTLGETLHHAIPRTVTSGDVALYTALTGSHFALHVSDPLARALGLNGAPLDDVLVFHLVFGKTVPDVSLNAVANLGYAEGRLLAPVYVGDTLSASSKVIGLRENSNRRTGTVYVRSTGTNQHNEPVIEFVRWVMVRKRDPQAPPPEPCVPELKDAVAVEDLAVPAGLDLAAFDPAITGEPRLWGDFPEGTALDHVDGVTVEEAEHMMATRLYHNTARVHFDAHAARGGRFGRRIVYGGHVISLARALSHNGFANALRVAAINSGHHVAPVFAGDTLYAWSEVLERRSLPGRGDLGALRVRTVATKDQPCANTPRLGRDGKYDPVVVLDLDTWLLMPRRH